MVCKAQIQIHKYKLEYKYLRCSWFARRSTPTGCPSQCLTPPPPRPFAVWQWTIRYFLCFIFLLEMIKHRWKCFKMFNASSPAHSPSDNEIRCESDRIFLAVHNSSIGDLVTDSLTQDFYFWHYRVTLENCDLWDIWSEWWGNMTWPTFWQFSRILTILTIFDNFDNCGLVWTIFESFNIFDNLDNFWQFW